jgi:hypothetical protein
MRTCTATAERDLAPVAAHRQYQIGFTYVDQLATKIEIYFSDDVGV